MKKILALFLICFVSASCDKKQEENLVLEIISDDLILIDAAAYKCGSTADSPDLASQIIKSNIFNLVWKGDRYLEVQSIRVELTGGQLPEPYKYVFSDDELFAMFFTSVLTFDPSPSGEGTEPNTSYTNEDRCAFKVGNIPIPEGSSGSLSGKIVFKGFTAKSKAGLDPENFRYEKDVNITYSP